MTLSLESVETTRELRALTEGEFETKYGCDRFTATVLSNRFRYIVDNLCWELITRSFSPTLHDFTDLASALSGPGSIGWPMPAVSQTLPLFFGSIPEAVQHALEEYGIERLVPGDVIIVNDPYRAGTHLNDVCLIRPVIVDGELIGALTLRAHMLDWGGKAKGGFALDKASLYEDGLVFAPELLYHAGKPVEPMFKIIRDNTRFASMVVQDIQTMFHCLEDAEKQLAATYRRYGREAYLGAMVYTCDASAETTRQAIERLPDGVYEGVGGLDSNGLGGGETALSVHVRVNKRGANIEFDFSGTSAANESSLNCAWPDAKTGATNALKWLIDPKTPYTSASARNVDVVVPPDTFINPSPPLSSNLYFIAVHAVITAVMDALNTVLGANAVGLDSGDMAFHLAHGTDAEDGTPWFAHPGAVMLPVPWGATKEGDGEAGNLAPYVNQIWSGDEPAEVDLPFVVLGRDYIPDTGGVGEHRGGPSALTDTLWLGPAGHRGFCFMSKRIDGGGVNGGGPGSPAAAWVFESEAVERVSTSGLLPCELPADAYAAAKPLYGTLAPETNEINPEGDYYIAQDLVSAGSRNVVRFVTNGGGGWGNPYNRKIDAVLEDVRNEYVSIAGAERDYGVVILGDPSTDPEGLSIDHEATARLRSRKPE